MTRTLSLRTLLAATLAVPVLAWAGPIGYTAWDVSGSDRLMRIDLSTGQGTVIGSNLGFSDVDGLSFDGSGRLWAVDDSSNRLLSIDIGTGSASSVGSFGSGFNDMGLAWGGSSMFMSSTDNAGNGKLYTVNTGTGAATLIGSFGGGLKVRSLGWYDGTLYGWSNVDTLLTINTSTGAATTVGSFGFGVPTLGQDGMDIDPATGLAWAIAEYENRIYTIDRSTGAATVVVNGLSCDGGSCAAGGFNGLAISAVPEPGSMVLMLAGLGVLGLRVRRRGLV
jgi:PEP-CTERM motif